jgi:hypothetical protein
MGKCKECWRAQVIERRRTNPAVQAYDRMRAKRPEVKARIRAVADQWRLDHPDAYRAHTAVGNALRDGKLVKGPCAVCGTTEDIHGHHADYSRPLDVTWLCALHHHRMHAAEGPRHGAESHQSEAHFAK